MSSRPQLNLRQSVGQGGVNDPADVRVVQAALSAVVPTDLRPDGVCGPATIEGIRRYQASFLRAPDGLCDPGGRTLRRLRADFAKAPAAARSAEWEGPPEGWSQAKKLASLNPTFRAGVVAILDELRGAGFAPTIACGWRALEAGGVFRLQNAQLPDGTPNAWAADVVEIQGSGGDTFEAALSAATLRQGFVGGEAKARVQGLGNPELRRIRRESGLG